MLLHNRSVVFAEGEVGRVCTDAILSMGAEILALFTSGDAPYAHGVPVFTDSPELHLDAVRELNPDTVFSFGYSRAIPDEIIGLAAGGAYNLECEPVNLAIINGEEEISVSLCHMTAESDDGVVDSETVSIGLDDTARDLCAGVTEAARSVTLRGYPLIVAGVAPRRRRDKPRAATFGARAASNGAIDWNMSAAEIYNLVRGSAHPFTGAFSYLRDDSGAWKKVFIWRARALPNSSTKGYAPGSVLSLAPLGAATGGGVLQIELIQLEGEEELSATNFTGVHRLRVGQAFDSLDANEEGEG